MSPSHVPAAGLSHDQYPREFLQSHPHRWPKEPIESSLLTSTAFETIDYDIQLEPGKQIRNYQWELAEPGIKEENYIICAPTGTGKTLVAGLIISEHLQKRKQMIKPGKVLFMVTTKPLAQQQKGTLDEMIPQASVKSCIGDDGSTIEQLLKDEDIIVCTAGKLLNELKEDKVHLEEISLIVIDECHHTVKEAPQAKVMEIYLERKQQGKAMLPQVVGLTASPGAGDNPSLELEKTLHHLISLCALMDATSGIKTVTENVDELEKHKNKSTSRLESPNGREHGEEFISRITKEMADLEQLVSLRCPFPRWSQQYETSIQQKKQLLEMSLNPDHRNQINVLNLLRCYSQALNIYMDLRYEDAMAVLDEFMNFMSEEQATSLQKELKQRLECLKAELKELPRVPNPLLTQVKKKLCSQFAAEPMSKAICFVRTKKHASAFCDWISKLESRVEIRPNVFVGHTRETGPGMTQIEQEDVMKGFREGKYNLLVATSVAEEGLDVPACNLVIRYQHISNEIAKVQTLGRARAANSQGFTILSSNSKKSFQEMRNEELDALVTEALLFLPVGQLLRDKVQKAQQEIIRDRAFKKRLVFLQYQSKFAYRDSVQLKCKVCKVNACKGGDIYVTESAYVVIDERFIENKIQIKLHHSHFKKLSEKVTKMSKMYCRNCNSDWGVMCIWPSEGYELPVLKCKSFIFEIDGVPRPVRKWSEAPFDIPPLSSHTGQLKLAEFFGKLVNKANISFVICSVLHR